MRKFIISIALLLSLFSIGYALPVPSNPVVSAVYAVGITDNAATHQICRAVWIGTTQSVDLNVFGSWVTFQGSTAGTLIPIQAVGARLTSGGGAPSSGDVVFLY